MTRNLDRLGILCGAWPGALLALLTATASIGCGAEGTTTYAATVPATQITLTTDSVKVDGTVLLSPHPGESPSQIPFNLELFPYRGSGALQTHTIDVDGQTVDVDYDNTAETVTITVGDNAPITVHATQGVFRVDGQGFYDTPTDRDALGAYLANKLLAQDIHLLNVGAHAAVRRWTLAHEHELSSMAAQIPPPKGGFGGLCVLFCFDIQVEANVEAHLGVGVNLGQGNSANGNGG
jgi:hypothetical protein